MATRTLRASVTADAQNLNPGDPAPILVDGSDSVITANGLGGYAPMPGDRLLVQQVGQTMEVVQFVSVGSVPFVITYRQPTDPALDGAVPEGAIWYDTGNGNVGKRRESGAWVTMTLDSNAMNVIDVRAATVERGFVLGGGGVGVLSNGASNPTAGPIVSNYWPSWQTSLYNTAPGHVGEDVSAFWGGMTTYHADSTKWVIPSIFFGTNIRVLNKSDGQLGAFPDPTNGQSWCSQFYAWGGIARDASHYWMIGSDNNRSTDIYIYAINQTNYAKAGELRLGSSTTFNGFHPRLVGDIANNRVGMIWIPLSGNLMLRWYTYGAFGALTQVGSDITLKTGVGQQNIGDAVWGDCGSGLGASTLWVAIEGDSTSLPNVMCWSSVSTTAATRQTTADFKKPSANKIHSMEFDTTTGHFQTYDTVGVARETSQIAQVPGSSTSVTARTTYYDGDTGNYAGAPGSGTVIINGVDVSGTASTAHETGYSPTTTFTTARRAWVRITSASHAPDETNLDSTKVDRANRIGFYTAIGGGTMWRQVYGSVGQIIADGFDAFPSSGTPDSHTFATAQVALGIFESAATRLDGTPKFYLDGSGVANIDGLIPPGTIIMWTGTTIPAGWLECNGGTVSRTTYADLANVFLVSAGVYRFGNGNGSTTFHLPDMRGRLPVGFDVASNLANLQNIGGSELANNVGGGTAPGQGDGGRHNHQHTHGAGTNVTIVSNTNNTGTANRVSNAPATNWTDSMGVNGANQAYHPLLTLRFLVKT